MCIDNHTCLFRLIYIPKLYRQTGNGKSQLAEDLKEDADQVELAERMITVVVHCHCDGQWVSMV